MVQDLSPPIGLRPTLLELGPKLFLRLNVKTISNETFPLKNQFIIAIGSIFNRISRVLLVNRTHRASLVQPFTIFAIAHFTATHDQRASGTSL